MPFDLAESFIQDVENILGANLPETYRKSMRLENGGEIETNSDYWQQYPIADTSDRKRLSRSANHILKETENCKKWPRFPENGLAIAGNGSGDQLVLLKQGESFSSAVYLWSHETGQLVEVANDFSELKAL
jgi:hypothetical protein